MPTSIITVKDDILSNETIQTFLKNSPFTVTIFNVPTSVAKPTDDIDEYLTTIKPYFYDNHENAYGFTLSPPQPLTDEYSIGLISFKAVGEEDPESVFITSLSKIIIDTDKKRLLYLEAIRDAKGFYWVCEIKK